MKIYESIQELKKLPKKKFKQTFDLIINLKNFDYKKPDNKFSKEITMPEKIEKEIKVGIISDKIPNAITKEHIEQFKKSEIKKLSKEYDYFLCEPQLMILVGKVLGRYLGPKGKMPKILPPNTEPKNLVDNLKKSIKIKTGQSSIQTFVGKEDMDDEKIQKNIEKVVEEVKKSLPKGEGQIKNILLKLTMSKPIKISV